MAIEQKVPFERFLEVVRRAVGTLRSEDVLEGQAGAFARRGVNLVAVNSLSGIEFSRLWILGELRPSQIAPLTVKQYRRELHERNARIRAAAEAGKPLRDRRGQRLRSLGNRSINATLCTLAAVLDEDEDAGWVVRNVARGRRMREPEERKKGDVLEPDEFLSLLEAADELDRERHSPRTLEKAESVRVLRDQARMPWKKIAERLRVAPTTAMYLYQCEPTADPLACGPRRAIIATLGLAGLRVTELCALDRQHINLATATIHVRDAKTKAGIRAVDIRPRLLDDLTGYWAAASGAEMTAPAFPTKTGRSRTKDNVRARVILPVLKRANELRAKRGQPPILGHVTPHTFRRTYVTFMLAAGFDVPYVRVQVGHTDPTMTLAIYAHVIDRPDRDRLRSDMRELLGERPTTPFGAPADREKAEKGSNGDR